MLTNALRGSYRLQHAAVVGMTTHAAAAFRLVSRAPQFISRRFRRYRLSRMPPAAGVEAENMSAYAEAMPHRRPASRTPCFQDVAENTTRHAFSLRLSRDAGLAVIAVGARLSGSSRPLPSSSALTSHQLWVRCLSRPTAMICPRVKPPVIADICFGGGWLSACCRSG